MTLVALSMGRRSTHPSSIDVLLLPLPEDPENNTIAAPGQVGKNCLFMLVRCEPFVDTNEVRYEGINNFNIYLLARSLKL